MTPCTAACQASLSRGFSRQEHWSRLPFPSPGDLPDPGMEPVSLVSPALVGILFSSVQLLSRVRLCDPINCSIPGLPVHHQLLEFTQTQVHQVGDAIQPSHPLSSPFPALSLSQQKVFSNESALLHQVARVLELQLQHQSFQ